MYGRILILVNFYVFKSIQLLFERFAALRINIFVRISLRLHYQCIVEIITLGGDSGSQIDLHWEQVRPVRDRWPRVDTFFHRVTCKGIKIPHSRFYRHRGMSRRMFRRRGKSALPEDAERMVRCLAQGFHERHTLRASILLLQSIFKNDILYIYIYTHF